MAESSMFWDGTATGDAALFAPYNENEFGRALSAISGAEAILPQKSGAFGPPGFLIGLASPDISIGPGIAQVFGTIYINDSNYILSVPVPGTAPRKDRVVIRKDWSQKKARITRLAGTEGGGYPPPVYSEGIIWDMPLISYEISTAGVISLVVIEFVYLPYATSFYGSSLPTVISIPNLILSAATLNAITALNFLSSAPSLISAPSLNYNGLTGLVPPMVSLWITPTMATLPPAEVDDLVIFNARRVDTTNGAMWSPTTNPSRITAPLTGLYLVSAKLGVFTQATVQMDLVFKIRRNGTTVICTDQAKIHSGAGGDVSGYQLGALAPTVINLSAGEYIELLLDHVGTGSPLWMAPKENMFSLQYVGARTSNVIGSII